MMLKDDLKDYKKAISIGKLGFWKWDAITNETYWSDEKFELFGYQPQEFELNYETAFQTVHPEDVATIGKILEEKMPTENEFDYEYRGIKKNGDQIYVWVRVTVLRNEKGEAVGLSGTSQDITERKILENKVLELNSSLEKLVNERTAALEKKVVENELLVKEMHHRVKNNLQVIASILNLQKKFITPENVKDVLEECVLRINSMGLIHDSLYTQNSPSEINVEQYFTQLIESHLKGEREIAYHLSVENIHLPIIKMVSLGLIINELISNSIKHAFVEQDNPSITLTIKRNPNCIDVSYSDNGIGFVFQKEKQKKSFGLELIETLLKNYNDTYSFDKKEHEMITNFCIPNTI